MNGILSNLSNVKDDAMLKDRVIIEVNSNFHHLAGQNLYEQKNKRFNEYRKRWREWPEKFKKGEFPLFIDIEVTSACNLGCPFCATTFRQRAIKKGVMSFDILKRIIDEGRDNNLYGVKFNIRGEPLLHPQLPDFVRYAKDKGLIDVYFNTNGMLLTEKVSQSLIETGLDRLSISFEGYTKDMYERYRVGAKYETVLSNIQNLQSLKKKLGVEHPKIRIQTVMFPDIEPIFDEYQNFWAKRVDEVAFLDYKNMREKKKGIRYHWACPQVWQRMAIWWDGTILPCNHDDEGSLRLGNIQETSIKEAWHSEKLNRIRKKHKAGQSHELAACNGCYLRDSEIDKLIKRETI